MRHAYLLPPNGQDSARGGVRRDDGSSDYELEVGNRCSASTKMIAYCTLIDEVEDFLRRGQSVLGKTLLTLWEQEKRRLDEIYKKETV